MADIELVIKISEHYYENNIKKELPIYLSEDNIVAILPKGHGRLIDADDMIADLQKQCKEVFRLDAVKPEDYYIAKDAKFMQATWKEWCDSFCVWANNRKAIVDADGTPEAEEQDAKEDETAGGEGDGV